MKLAGKQNLTGKRGEEMVLEPYPDLPDERRQCQWRGRHCERRGGSRIHGRCLTAEETLTKVSL